MTIEPIGPIGLTVAPPEELPANEEYVEEAPPPESAPLPSYQGTVVDQSA